ncbi:MAG: hypothetical protein NC080_02330 [Paraprevotella sp.]|nr:hypothetical protein [Paraprevotella sp.]
MIANNMQKHQRYHAYRHATAMPQLRIYETQRPAHTRNGIRSSSQVTHRNRSQES